MYHKRKIGIPAPLARDKGVGRQQHIIDDVLHSHMIYGCDIVGCLWGSWKGTLFKFLKSGKRILNNLSNTQEQENDGMSQCTKCIVSCYGY